MTIQEFGRQLRARTRSPRRRSSTRACARIEAGNQATQRLHSGDGGRSAAAGARGRPRAGRGPRPGAAARRAAVDQRPHRRPRHGHDCRVARSRRPHRRRTMRRSIAHLRAAGAVFVGKTNLHEYALGTTSGDSAFGPARNPLDTDALARRLERRIGGQRRRRDGARHRRHRHRRLDQDSRRLLRHRRA